MTPEQERAAVKKLVDEIELTAERVFGEVLAEWKLDDETQDALLLEALEFTRKSVLYRKVAIVQFTASAKVAIPTNATPQDVWEMVNNNEIELLRADELDLVRDVEPGDIEVREGP